MKSMHKSNIINKFLRENRKKNKDYDKIAKVYESCDECKYINPNVNKNSNKQTSK